MSARDVQRRLESVSGAFLSCQSHRVRRAVLVAFSMMFVVDSVAIGATYSWKVPSGDWSIASNWGGALPTGSDYVSIANGGTAAITLPGQICLSLYAGDPNSANTGTIQMSGGRLTANNEYLGNGGAGTFNQSGGTNNFNNNIYLGYSSSSSGNYSLSGSGVLSAIVGSVHVGYSGIGNFNQSGAKSSINALYLGENAGSSGSYALGGSGVLNASTEYLGYTGSGAFTQSGGTNAITSSGFLYLGENAGGTGSYTLNGPGVLSASIEYLGYSGTGSFNQSGGTNTFVSGLNLGYSASSSGNYSLSGSGILSGSTGNLGYSGVASFNQSGGTCKINILYLGYNVGYGSYTLNGPGVLNTGTQYLGYSGSAAFTQSAGTNNAGTIFLGYNTASRASYSLNGSGVMSAQYEYVGYSGSGAFSQSGGTNSIAANGSLTIGANNNKILSIYNLSSSGVLLAPAELIGAGSIVQIGGWNSAGSLTINGSGRYQFSGGTLQIGGLLNQGTFDATGSSGVLNVAGSQIVDLSKATLVNTDSMSLNIGTNTIVFLPAGFDPTTALRQL